MTARVLEVEDHGMWRGHHSWTIHMEDENGRSQVSARGATEAEAIADARSTFANRRIFTDGERDALRSTNDALRKRLR